MSKRSNADKQRRARARRESKKAKRPERDFREFMRSAAGPVSHSVIDAFRRGESVLDAWLGAMSTHLVGATAQDAYQWVKESKGRKVVLGWEGDFIRLQYFDADGKEVLQ